MTERPVLFVISGPSGVGKGSMISRVKEVCIFLKESVSATTRPPRASEQDGVDYFFFSNDAFDAAIAADEFIEYCDVHGNRYGTLKREVDAALSSGDHVIVEVDVQGAAKLMSTRNDIVSIFIKPPSIDELRRRLMGRNTEDDAVVKKRIDQATLELQEQDHYDYVILNENLDDAVETLVDIINKEKKTR